MGGPAGHGEDPVCCLMQPSDVGCVRIWIMVLTSDQSDQLLRGVCRKKKSTGVIDLTGG